MQLLEQDAFEDANQMNQGTAEFPDQYHMQKGKETASMRRTLF